MRRRCCLQMTFRRFHYKPRPLVEVSLVVICFQFAGSFFECAVLWFKVISFAMV